MKMAEALKTWLPDVIQTVEPWVSSQDISKGSRGLREVAGELEGSDFGIICVTADNQPSQWVNFEAGALSKQIENSLVVPLLLDMKVTDLTGLLAQFQATDSTSKDDFNKLVRDINSALKQAAISPERLDRAFERNWPDLEGLLDDIRAEEGPQPATPGRADSEMLEELLVLARQQERRLVDIESLIHPLREDTGFTAYAASSKQPTRRTVSRKGSEILNRASVALEHHGAILVSGKVMDNEITLMVHDFPKEPDSKLTSTLELLAKSADRSIIVVDANSLEESYRYDWPF